VTPYQLVGGKPSSFLRPGSMDQPCCRTEAKCADQGQGRAFRQYRRLIGQAPRSRGTRRASRRGPDHTAKSSASDRRLPQVVLARSFRDTMMVEFAARPLSGDRLRSVADIRTRGACLQPPTCLACFGGRGFRIFSTARSGMTPGLWPAPRLKGLPCRRELLTELPSGTKVPGSPELLHGACRSDQAKGLGGTLVCSDAGVR
jgi:hypothetical protein